MKKVRWGRLGFVIAIINTLAIVACSGVLQYIPTPTIDAPSKELLVKMAGRRAGYELATKYPSVSGNLLKATEIIATDPSVAGVDAISSVINILAEKDPLFAMEVEDFLSLIKFENPVISEEDKLIMKAALNGLAQGLRLGGAKIEGEGGASWTINYLL